MKRNAENMGNRPAKKDDENQFFSKSSQHQKLTNASNYSNGTFNRILDPSLNN
jgi:hypothetical protein